MRSFLSAHHPSLSIQIRTSMPFDFASDAFRLRRVIRSGPPDWPGGDAAWRAQEPENAHSHLLSMLIGNSETIPVVDGELALGTWQSVMLVELDGPRTRTLGVQVVGVGVEKRADAGEPLGAYKSEAKGAAVVAESSGVDSAAAAYDDAFDAFCEEDPSADECKVFD